MANTDFTNFLEAGARLLIILSVGLFIFIVVNIFFVKPERTISLGPDDAAAEDVTPEKIVLPQAKDFAGYAGVIQGRDIFKLPYARKPAITAAEAAQQNPAQSAELTKNYKLVGILIDEKPTAVIEDLKNQQTLFLQKGDRIGSAVLEEVQQGKVVFGDQGRQVEILP